MDEDSKPKKNYEVGYRKPPRDRRFKPGKSGNPRGRPKGSKSFETLWIEKFRGFTRITIGGKKRRVNNKKLLVDAAFAAAMKGDLKLIEKLGGLREPDQPETRLRFTLKLEEDPKDIEPDYDWDASNDS